MIVGLAVVPDDLYVVECFFYESVFVCSDFLVDCAEVHGVLDDEGVIGEAEC